jgi:hypothetical protein
MVSVLFTVHCPTLTEYLTVFVPLLAIPGLNNPVGEMALFPTPLQVPFEGLPVNVTGAKISQSGPVSVIVGVSGLLMLMPTVLVMGQFKIVGVTTRL